MIRIQQLKLPVTHTQEELEQKIRKTLKIGKHDLQEIELLRRSIDARKKSELKYVYQLDVKVKDENAVLRKAKNNQIVKAEKKPYVFPKSGEQTLVHRPVIIGSGPAGLFCAYVLAKHGYRPLVLERGESAEQRKKSVDAFWKTGVLNPESNVQFGEGADYRMAVSVAENSAVLLKNEKGVLPLAKGCKAVFLGEFAQHPRYQGGGSSHVNSAKVSCALEHAPGVAYAQGYRTDEDTVDPALEQAAVAAAVDADVAVIFAGLPERYESEGYDRTTLAMPENQNHLIAAVAAVQPNTVVVLHNGSAIEMPWVNDVPAVLELYLAGDGAGEAAVNLLYGAVNPSGKLAETFPRRLSDTPAYLSFPGERETSVYSEGVFVGYRYYDTTEADVLFPFGHGLSYTTFEYSVLRLSRSTVREGEEVQVTVTVKNTGAVAGKETVQLYVAPPKGERHRPVRELKGFAKVSLQPGESKEVQFTLDKRSLAYYEPELHDFYAESGTYQICVGASSRDLRLTGLLEWQAAQPLPVHFTAASTLKQVMTHPVGAAIIGPILQHMAAAAGSATGKKDDDDSSLSMMMGIQLNTLIDFHVLTEEQLNGILSQINQA